MALQLQTYNVRIRLLEMLLGTVPRNKSVYSSYIASKAADHAAKELKRAGKHKPTHDEPHAPAAAWANGETIREQQENGDGRTALAVAEEETETVQEIEEKGWTGFHRDDHGNLLYSYAIKGFLKEAARTLKEHGDGDKKVKQLQDKVTRYVFVAPRRIYLPDTAEVMERPLRCMTAQGPRVTVTRSDMIPAGTPIEYQIRVLQGGGITRAILEDILAYGEMCGLGQWRSGGWGNFSLELLERID